MVTILNCSNILKCHALSYNLPYLDGRGPVSVAELGHGAFQTLIRKDLLFVVYLNNNFL